MKNNKKLLILAFTILIEIHGFAIFMPMLPYLAKHFHASGFQVTSLITVYSLAQFIFSPLLGKMSDKVGRRPVILLSLFVNICCYILLGFVTNLTEIFLLRVVAGAGAGVIATSFAYGSDISNKENRPKVMAMLGASLGLGFIFGPMIGGILGSHSLQLPMFVSASLSFLAFLMALFFLEESYTKEARMKAHNQPKIPLAKVIFSTGLINFLIIIILLAGAFATFESIYIIYASDNLNYTSKDIGIIFMCLGTISVLIQGGIMRILLKHMEKKKIIIMGSIIMILSFVLIPHMNSMITNIFAVCILAGGWGMVSPLLNSIGSLYATPQTHGVTMGVVRSASIIARILGSLIAGILYDQVSIQAPFYFTILMLIIGVILLLTQKVKK